MQGRYSLFAIASVQVLGAILFAVQVSLNSIPLIGDTI
jgi:hypothetical protein